MVPMARARLEPEARSFIQDYQEGTEAQVLGPFFTAFPVALAESWVRCEGADKT